MEEMVNKYKAAEMLDLFKKRYMEPLDAEVNTAHAIISDDNYPWPNKEVKEKALHKYRMLDTRNIDFARLHNACFDLCLQHETLVNLLCSLYMRWYNNISYEGKQQREMMSMQAKMLQGIFIDLHEALKPLELEGIINHPPKAVESE